jgi:hypothetical protein
MSVFTEHESGLKENELEAVLKLSRKVVVLLVGAYISSRKLAKRCNNELKIPD